MIPSTAIQLWSGPRWAADSQLVAFASDVVTLSSRLRLGQDHELNMTVERSADWLSEIRPGRHLWMPSLSPQAPEWRLDSRSVSTTGVVGLRWIGVRSYLGELGPVVAERGRGEVSNLRGVNLSALNYLSTFILPFLARRGVDWIGIGTVDRPRQFELAWEGLSVPDLLDLIATQAEGEWWLQPVQGGYLLDLVERTGGDAEEVWVSEGVDLLELRRNQPMGNLTTVIRPMGKPSTGGEPSRSTLAENAWRVAGLDGATVQLAHHRGGRGPILEDGQFASAIPGVAPHGYGLMWGGTVSPISGSAAPDLVTVDDPSGLAVGEDAMIVLLDEAGEALGLTELPSPSGIAVSGVIVRPMDTQLGGSRNWAANPFLRGGEGQEVAVGRWASGTGSTIEVTDLPADTVFPAGSQVMVTGSGAGGIGPLHYLQGSRLASDATSNGSGEATLSLVSGLSATPSISLPPVRILPPPTLPAGWEDVDGGGATARMATALIRSTARAVLNASTVGAHNFAASSPYILRRVALEGLAAGDRIYPGDLIQAASGLGMMAMEEVEVPADVPSPSLPTGLVGATAVWRGGMYRSGPVLEDESGNGHDAVFPGGGRDPVPGGGGFPGLYFGGSGQHLRVPSDPAFHPGPTDDLVVLVVFRGPISKPSINGLLGTLAPGGKVGWRVTATGAGVGMVISDDGPTALVDDETSAATADVRWVLALRDADTAVEVTVEGSGTPTAGSRGDLGNEEDLFIGSLPGTESQINFFSLRGTILGAAVLSAAPDPGDIAGAVAYLSEVASGSVSVAVADPVGTAPNWADATPVTITRPPVPWVGEAGIATWVPQRDAGNMLRQAMAVELPFIRPGQTVRARAYWALGAWSGGPWTWESGASAITDVHAPVLQLRRTDTSAVVASDVLDPLVLSAGEWEAVLLDCTYVVPDPVPSLRLELLVPGGVSASGGTQRFQVLPIFLGGSLDYGPSDFPVIEGAEASDMWQEAAEKLRVARAWSSTYQGSRIALAEALQLDPAAPVLEIGGEVRLRHPAMGIDEYLRVREIEVPDLLQAPGERPELLTLDTDPARITEEAVRRAGVPLYANIGAANTIPSEAPPRTPGAVGAQVASGQPAPATPDPLPLEVLP